MSGMSTYLENTIVDFLFRAQAYTPPPTLYVALYTAEPAASGGGTEVSGGSYARAATTSGLAGWAGTQGAGTTAASNGTSATTSNNGAITFPAPTADWGVITAFGILDAASGGNLLFYGILTNAKTVNDGDAAPAFAAAALSIQIDS